MKKKILIVDDASFMQKVTSDMLSEKYDTICASSGQEALAVYEAEKPDMILTDLLMPGMTGLELQKILSERYSEPIPIMFMTADEREENESRGLAGGAMDYIRKPFNKDILLRRVDNIIRQMERIAGLKHVAETDPMTGLLNKASAQQALRELCGKASGTLMMVDLDSFKLVNDIYGHDMGDKILIRFAEILRSVIRSSDVAGRMGGDEFIVFCRDIRDEAIIAEKSAAINEQILSSAKAMMGEGMNIPLGASIGAVKVPNEGTDFDLLFHKADQALYGVKQNGKHGWAFFSGEDGGADQAKGAEGANTIANVRKILDERNRKPGAYELGFESFRSVYRYLIRSIENYHKVFGLVLFTLVADPDTVSAFAEVLALSLRRSDVFTKSGKYQYMVLLSEMEGADETPILKRIMDNWEASGKGRVRDLSHDTVIIRAAE